MTLRNRALLLVGILGIVSSATAGCELIADFDRSKIDGGSAEAPDGQAPDGSTFDANPPFDAGTDSTLPTDASDGAVTEDATNDTNVGETGADSGDAGCSGSTGCPVAMACDLATHLCTTTCSASQPCNAACCNGTTCQATESPTSCGAGGTSCASCVAQDAGAACVPGSNGGTCGCEIPSDCPLGEACNTTTHQCTTSCSASQLCNTGCCASGTCSTGTATGACGSVGTACLDCATDSLGTKCLAATGGGVCGCTLPGDCDVGDAGGGACNTTAHQCTVSCSVSQVCSGSCCNGGTCGGGTTTACGPAGGTCTDCTADTHGHQCLGTACGCNDPADCPVGNSCDQGSHLCVTACSSTQACNGACCNGTTCVTTDSAQTTCGAAGAMCSDCTANGNLGSACRAGGTCGCNGPTDCPAGFACDTSVHTCTATCSSTQTCNGACCNGTTCEPNDTAPGTCGATGTLCKDCPVLAAGSACLANGSCGCNSSSDCPTDQACNVSTHQCTTACSTTQTCNTGCCSAASNGTCQPGTAQNECGATGGLCGTCVGNSVGTACEAVTGGGQCGCTTEAQCNNLEACNTGVSPGQCTTSCSASQACNGSCCDPNTLMCATDTATATCGSAGGACADCTGNTSGDKCVASQCGCNTAADCPTGNACDTGTHLCTTACSATQLCNGGCCSDATSGTCQVGTANTECGTSGVCNDCIATCAAGSCSCNGVSVCVGTSISSFTAAITGGLDSSTMLSWTTVNATTCSIDHGVGTVTCGTSSVGTTPLGTGTYTLTATGPGGTTTATVTVTCNAVSNPSQGASACPTGATQVCETVPIVATSSSQAQDACNVCNGAGTCTQDAADVAIGNANAWIPPVAAGVVYYVYSDASLAASAVCTNVAYQPLAGDTISAGTCPESRWAP